MRSIFLIVKNVQAPKYSNRRKLIEICYFYNNFTKAYISNLYVLTFFPRVNFLKVKLIKNNIFFAFLLTILLHVSYVIFREKLTLS